MADRKIPSITCEETPAPIRSLLCASIAAPAGAGRPGAVAAHCRPCVRRWQRHHRRRSPACRSAAALCRSPVDGSGGWVADHVAVAGDRRACRCWSPRRRGRPPPPACSVLASSCRRRSPACRSAAALCRSPLDAAGGWVAGHVAIAVDRGACRCWSTRQCSRSPPAARSALASSSRRRSPGCRSATAWPRHRENTWRERVGTGLSRMRTGKILMPIPMICKLTPSNF